MLVLFGLVQALLGVVVGLGLPSAAASGQGWLRVAHLSPDTPAVDFSVDPVDAASPAAGVPGVGYGTVSGYRAVPAGVYRVGLRRAGADPTTPPLLSTTVRVEDGAARTVAGVGSFGDLGLRVLEDDLSPPPAGQARVRVVDAAARAGAVDVSVAGGPSLASGLPFPSTSGYVDVPAGRPSLQVAPAGVTATVPPLTVAPGTVTSVLLLDAAGGGLTVRPVLDAAGPAAVPSGSVPAGEGGTAGDPPAGRAVLTGALAALTRWANGAAELPGWAVPARPDSSSAPPLRVTVPRIGVDSTLVPLALDPAGALVPPVETALAGWSAQGTRPGAVGPAVIAGHVDSYRGPGVFSRLRQVAPGDLVLVDRADGTTLTFVVTRVDHYRKDAFPTARVYGPTPGPELRLITCGGAFDRSARSYEEDVVVSATERG